MSPERAPIESGTEQSEEQDQFKYANGHRDPILVGAITVATDAHIFPCRGP